MNERISIIMGAYNCASTLRESINSILSQTHTNWEFIICDDGSTDSTSEILHKYALDYPDKFTILRNKTNLGLNATLNRCLAHATGEFIARMDADDTCSQNRLETELTVFRQEPDISIVSTGMNFFDETGVWGYIRHPEYPQKSDFIRESPFCHAPCLVRKAAFDAVGGYSEGRRFLRVEDYHLWFKMYRAGFVGKNLPEPLYQMRDDRNALSRRKFRYRFNEAYIKLLIMQEFRLPLHNFFHVCRPIIVGLLPDFLYSYLHKKRLQ